MFLHTFHPSSIFINLGFISIHYYGLLIALAVGLGFLVFYQLARRAGFEKNFIVDLVFWGIVWGLIGGRLYHVLSVPNYYWHHPLEILAVWHGGLGIYGSILAGILVIIYFSKKHIKKEPLLPYCLITFLLLDLLAPALALGQAIGRWGNYFNQELYGLPTNLPWGIPIDVVHRLIGYENFQFFHPVFLYESLFCIFLFVILRRFVVQQQTKKGSRGRPTGFVFLVYLAGYSLWRFLIEFMRLDSQPELLGLRLGQWVSMVILALAVIFYVVLRKWYNKKVTSNQ